MDIYAKLREILCQQIKRRSFVFYFFFLETKLNQLGLDSLDTAELVINIEEEFELPEVTQEEMMSIETVKDLKELIERKKA